MVFRVIGWIILASIVLVGLVAVLIAFGLFNFRVVSPWLYERTTRAAEAANDAYWADGIARIYTLEAKIEVGGETFTATSELTCAPKSFTRPQTIKDKRVYRRGTTRRGLWINVWGFEAGPLSIPLPDASEVAFPFNMQACQSLPHTLPPRGDPGSLKGTALFVHVKVATQPRGQCNVSVSKGPVAIGETTIFPIAVVSMREVRLRDTLSREQYGAASDRYPGRLVGYPSETSAHWMGNWDRDLSCWNKGADRGPADCPFGGQPACPVRSSQMDATPQ